MNSVLQSPPGTRSTDTVRAARIDAPRSVSLIEASTPEPGPGQVRIRIEGCGLCGSNLPLWEGRDWFAYPLVPGAPGHEGWGTIDAIGGGVSDVAVGDRVTALSQHAFADVDIADAQAVVRLPSSLAGCRLPGEPLGCAMNVFRRCGIKAGQSVAIIGIGFLGALLVQLAARAGARVIAVSRRPFALEVAQSCGATELLELGDIDHLTDGIRALTAGAFCDRVIEAAGLQQTLTLAGRIVRERGRLVIAGFHQDGLREVDMFEWNWRGIDVINAHERDPAVYVRGMREAVTAIAAGLLDPEPLYTHEYPLDRVGSAFDDMQLRPDGFLKALVRP